MTCLACAILAAFSLGLSKAIGTIRPIYRERSRLNAEVTGRLNESLAGVRVVKGYRAEAREERVFAEGVQRLLDNVLKTLTATSAMSLSATVLQGVVVSLITFVGARRILAGSMTLGTFLTFGVFLGLLIAPIYQIVSIGTQLTEGMAGLERTSEILKESPEDAAPERTELIGYRCAAKWFLKTSISPMSRGKRCCTMSVSWPIPEARRDGAGGPLLVQENPRSPD